MTLKGQTKAHLYRPRDCSAHVRRRWLFNRTAVVLPKHVKPSYFRMRSQGRPFAGDA